MLKGYTTKQDIENYTLQSIGVSFDGQLDIWIESIEKFIEQYTGRIFIAGDAEAKLFDGDGSGELLVDDFIYSESDFVITLDDEAITEDLYLYPANSARKNKLEWDGGVFTRGKQNVAITSKWGFSLEAPADIRLATTILVAGIIAYSDGSKGKVRSESVGRYSVSYTTEEGWNDYQRVLSILDSYKKYEFNP
jgi:hypothetical protein